MTVKLFFINFINFFNILFYFLFFLVIEDFVETSNVNKKRFSPFVEVSLIESKINEARIKQKEGKKKLWKNYQKLK